MSKSYDIDHEAEHAKAVLPVLLAAAVRAEDDLAHLVRQMDDTGPYGETLEILRAAITKAEEK